jgi:hypothetical protein
LDIAAPQTLEASVPPIESAPSPLEVAPPEGFALDDEDIGVFGIDCGINDASCTRPKPKKPVIPKTVGDKSATDDPDNNPNVDGGLNDAQAETLAQQLGWDLWTQARNIQVIGGELQKYIENINAATQYWNPRARLYFNRQLLAQVETGAARPERLKMYLSEMSEKAKVAQSSFLTFSDRLKSGDLEGAGTIAYDVFASNENMMLFMESNDYVDFLPGLGFEQLMVEEGLLDYFGDRNPAMGGISWLGDYHGDTLIGMDADDLAARGTMMAALGGGLSKATRMRLNPTLDDFAISGQALDRNGLTFAGRALQKHFRRPGTVFTTPDMKASTLNSRGQLYLEDILTHPNTTKVTWPHPKYGQVTEFRNKTFGGVRYDANGNMMGFLDPNPRW